MFRLHHPTSGRADYGDATTAALIDELADILLKAEQWEAAIYKRLTPEQKREYDKANPFIDLYSARTDMAKHAETWAARLDAEAAQ